MNILLDRQTYIDSLESERRALLGSNKGLNSQLNKELQRLEALVEESQIVRDEYTRKWGVRELSHEVSNGLGLLHFDLQALVDRLDIVSVDQRMVAHFESFYSTKPHFFSKHLLITSSTFIQQPCFFFRWLLICSSLLHFFENAFSLEFLFHSSHCFFKIVVSYIYSNNYISPLIVLTFI